MFRKCSIIHGSHSFNTSNVGRDSIHFTWPLFQIRGGHLKHSVQATVYEGSVDGPACSIGGFLEGSSLSGR